MGLLSTIAMLPTLKSLKISCSRNKITLLSALPKSKLGFQILFNSKVILEKAFNVPCGSQTHTEVTVCNKLSDLPITTAHRGPPSAFSGQSRDKIVTVELAHYQLNGISLF